MRTSFQFSRKNNRFGFDILKRMSGGYLHSAMRSLSLFIFSRYIFCIVQSYESISHKIINEHHIDEIELMKKLNYSFFFFLNVVVYAMKRPQRHKINCGMGHSTESSSILNDLEIMSQLCHSAVKKYRRTLRCIV